MERIENEYVSQEIYNKLRKRNTKNERIRKR